MKKSGKYNDINSFITPVGEFVVQSETGEFIDFSVKRYADEREVDIGEDMYTIHTDNHYILKINIDNLQIGTKYKIYFSEGKWEYCDGDEHTVCYSTVIDDWVVGIGAFDPTDEEKIDQAWAYSKENGWLDKHMMLYPPHFDESKFKAYSVSGLEELNGFEFVVYDKSRDTVVFGVAWVKKEDYPLAAYNYALGLWLS